MPPTPPTPPPVRDAERCGGSIEDEDDDAPSTSATDGCSEAETAGGGDKGVWNAAGGGDANGGGDAAVSAAPVAAAVEALLTVLLVSVVWALLSVLVGNGGTGVGVDGHAPTDALEGVTFHDDADDDDADDDEA